MLPMAVHAPLSFCFVCGVLVVLLQSLLSMLLLSR